jgi:hypothetical protein
MEADPHKRPLEEASGVESFSSGASDHEEAMEVGKTETAPTDATVYPAACIQCRQAKVRRPLLCRIAVERSRQGSSREAYANGPDSWE